MGKRFVKSVLITEIMGRSFNTFSIPLLNPTLNNLIQNDFWSRFDEKVFLLAIMAI
jgi:hypothetical protein